MPTPVHPRVGGGHVRFLPAHSVPAGSSPRGRGTRKAITTDDFATRFIPAWAGDTREFSHRSLSRPVHPRVGGGHSMPTVSGHALPGSSPRGGGHTSRPSPRSSHPGSSPCGRGTRHTGGGSDANSRFIPAWAGDTPPSPAGRWRAPVHPRVGGGHRTTGLPPLS